jgi:hypothetical protein
MPTVPDPKVVTLATRFIVRKFLNDEDHLSDAVWNTLMMSAYHVPGYTSIHSVQPLLTKTPSPSGCLVMILIIGLQQLLA